MPSSLLPGWFDFLAFGQWCDEVSIEITIGCRRWRRISGHGSENAIPRTCHTEGGRSRPIPSRKLPRHGFAPGMQAWIQVFHLMRSPAPAPASTSPMWPALRTPTPRAQHRHIEHQQQR